METSEPSDHMRRLFRDDERHVWSTKPNLLAFFTATFVGTAATAVFFTIWGIPFFGAFGFAFMQSAFPSVLDAIVDVATANAFLILALFPVVWIAVVLFLTVSVAWPRYIHREYALTDDRVIGTSGLVGRDSSTISLKDVRDVDVNVGVLDKIFGTGNIQFQVAGGMGSGVDFTYLDDPYDVLETIEDARKKAESASTGPAD